MASTEYPSRALQLLERLSLVGNDSELDELLDRITSPSRPIVLSFVNAHAVNLACRDEAFFDALMASDVLLRDGVGVRIMCQVFGRDPGLNLNGTDLIPKILELFAGQRVALCGTEDPCLSEAADRIQGVAWQMDGFQPVESYVDPVRQSGARITVLAMGMPKQELVAQRLKTELDGPVLIVNGGAILDFIAGRVTRAPLWIRSVGLEWAFRLALEPRRLWSRYMVGNVVFLARLARLKLHPGTAAD
jgi:exopolysaccharide biosynthesis WecB/TagA/CpsF family protein